jgi:LysM repeat protein
MPEKRLYCQKTVHSTKAPVMAAIITTTFVTFFAFIPHQAHASMLSLPSFREVFKSGEFNTDFSALSAQAEIVPGTEVNSQNIPLLKANLNINPNPRFAMADEEMLDGQALMPTVGPAGTAADISESTLAAPISTYTVRRGDTVESIAQMFKVSANTVLWANDLQRSSVLREGATLVILPISGIQHTVKAGETLQGIVKKYKADIDEVFAYNELSSSALKVGQQLIIPDADITSDTANTSSGATKPASKTTKPIIRGGGPEYAGYYIRPIRGGRRTQGVHGFNAVDLADVIGTPIYASASGVVVMSKIGGWNHGYGNYVVISHPNGTQTLYAHTSQNLVQIGDQVQQGQMIARIGSTGKSTGPHVHFEIRGARNPF